MTPVVMSQLLGSITTFKLRSVTISILSKGMTEDLLCDCLVAWQLGHFHKVSETPSINQTEGKFE